MRKKREYFYRVGNFYRASQIIITAPNTPGFTFNDPSDYTLSYNATGIFQQYILNEVSIRNSLLMMPIWSLYFQIWHMQNDIIHLNASFKDNSRKEVMVTLNDICFKPFAPENTNCTIYSILSYFQDSYELLNREVKVLFTVASNSSYHIIFCTGL